MKNLLNQAKDNFKIYHKVIGEVIENEDPLNRGRMKCKIYGITENSTNYPWCEVKGILLGDKDTIGVSGVVDVGTLVYIEFLYGDPSHPIIDGYLRGDKDSSLLHTVTELQNTIYKTRTDNIILDELPPLNNNSNYPNNTVIETKSAVIELDDTNGNERISIQHKNGSYYEIRPDGTLQIKSIKDINNYSQENINIKSIKDINFKADNINYIVDDSIDINIQSNLTSNIGINYDEIIGGNYSQNATNRNITAITNHTGNYNIIGGNLSVSGSISAFGNGMVMDTSGFVINNYNITIINGDVVADGISLKNHTHDVTTSLGVQTTTIPNS